MGSIFAVGQIVAIRLASWQAELDSLKHLLQENALNASDLARLLGVHASLGSEILQGEHSLTSITFASGRRDFSSARVGSSMEANEDQSQTPRTIPRRRTAISRATVRRLQRNDEVRVRWRHGSDARSRQNGEKNRVTRLRR